MSRAAETGGGRAPAFRDRVQHEHITSSSSSETPFCHFLSSVPLWKHFHDDENEVLFIVASRGAKGRPALCQFKTRNLHSAGFAVAVIVFCDAGMPLGCRSVNYQQGLCPCLVPLLNKVFTETAWQLLEVSCDVWFAHIDSRVFSFKEFLFIWAFQLHWQICSNKCRGTPRDSIFRLSTLSPMNKWAFSHWIAQNKMHWRDLV